uniref:choice-of-anchor L domain-containing protein n=3 Tax=Flavobacterium sp. TaxID=239 RepID=UPI00404A22EB
MKKITLILFLFSFIFTCFSQVIDENFDGATFPPTGWIMTTNGVGSSVNPWTQTTNTALTNNASVGAARAVRQTTAPNQERQTWLITPQVTIPTNGQLRFFTRNELAGNQGTTFSVRISTDADPTNLAAYTVFQTWTELDLVAQYDEYEEKVLSLLANVGNNVFIAFVRSNVQSVPGINGNGDNWLVDDVLLIEQCLDPTGLSATAVLSTTATLNWTDPNGATEWQIEYGPQGFTPGTGTIVTADSNPFDIADLDPATQYSFYVQSVCSAINSSAQVGPQNFTTQIAPPVCGGQFFDSGGPTANYAANTNSIVTICPDNATDIVTVTFTSFQTETGWDALYVFQGDSNAAPQIDSNLGFGFGPNAALSGGFWSSVPNGLIPGPFESAAPGECLTFQFISDGIIQQAGWVANVTCAPAPTCPKPTAVSISAVTGDTATATWTDNAGASAWEYLLLPCGSPEPDANTPGFLPADDNPLDLIGLTSSTCYQFYVRAVCGPDDSSLWSTVSSFTTTQIPVALNYEEDFEGVHGWTLSNGTQTNKWVVGTAVSSSPTTSLYVSNNNGVANAYTTNASSVVHAYRDIQLPAIAGEINVSFDWRNVGENNFDYVRVWLVPATFLPTPGTQITAAASGGQQLGGNFVNNANFTTANFIVTATPFQGQVRRIIFEWRNDFIIGTQPPGAIDNVNISLITCPMPTNLVASEFSLNSAVINWNEIGTASSWEVFVVEQGQPGPNSASEGIIVTTPPPYTIEDLDAGTNYTVYVRSVCDDDDVSTWTAGVNFSTTLCLLEDQCLYSFIMTDSFGDGWNGNTMTISQNGVPVATIGSTFTFAQGNGPVIVQVPLCDGIPFTLFWNTGGAFANEVGISIIDSFEEDVYIKAPGVGNQNSALFTGLVNCTPPSCPRPNTFLLDTAGETTATISWTEVGTATQWEIILLPIGSPEPVVDAVGITTTENPYTFEGLDSGTQYTVYIRSLCDEDDISNWGGPLNFATLIENDECVDAILVPVNPDTNCAETVSGTIIGATGSAVPNACTGTADDDVWFQFVAESTTQVISLINVAGSTTNLETVVYTGVDCGALTQVFCSTNNETTINNLIVGQTYYVRVYSFTNAPGQTTSFDVCISTILPPISVSQTLYTNQELVEDILLNSTCATVSNIITSTGSNFGTTNGIGYFNKNGSSFPFEEGVILTSGNVTSAPGPNTNIQSNGTTAWPGDAQLTALANSTGANGITRNATILQFDFIPVIPEISFDFIFASEEYGTFQCTFTDVFAFYLSELDAADNIISTTNLAVVPGTIPPVPISVTTIRNNLFNGGCPSANATYFGQFYGGANGLPNIGSPTNYNGNTVPMVASSAVIPGTKYRIKLAIADYNDSAFDSAVFLNGGSFNIGNLDIGDDLLVDTGNALCDGETIFIDSELNPDSYDFVWYLGDDVLENETSPSLTITGPGTYTLEATFSNSDCVGSGSVTVEFFDPIEANEPDDLTFCDSSGTGIFDLTQNTPIVLELLTEEFIVTYFNTEEDAIDNINPITNPEEYTNISNPEIVFIRVSSTVSDCFVTSSFELNVQDLTPFFDFTNDANICEGEDIILLVTPTNFTEADEITYSWTFNTDPLTFDTPSIVVSEPGIYEVTVNNSGCTNFANMELIVTPELILTPIDDVFSCNEYILPTLTINNLLENGNFDMGNLGFETDYTYLPVNPVGGQGLYTVDTNPNTWFNAFAICSDHTTGDGNMLIVDGSTTVGGTDRVWCQTVTVIPNQDYEFSYWVQTIALPNVALIETRINGEVVGSSSSGSATCEWVEHTYTWNSGDNT